MRPTASRTQVAAAVTNLFYTINYLHDWFYDAGFNEAAGNAQTNNYGRGGVGGDSIFAEAQDYSGTNNANMNTPPDGQRPRMRMFLWTSGVSLVKVESPAVARGRQAVGDGGVRRAGVRPHGRRSSLARDAANADGPDRHGRLHARSPTPPPSRARSPSSTAAPARSS